MSEVDGAGAKPSIAVGASGTPYIAFTSEDMPGFVKSAVLHAGTWDIATVATGYLYGPLDIALDSDGSPHISGTTTTMKTAPIAGWRTGSG